MDAPTGSAEQLPRIELERSAAVVVPENSTGLGIAASDTPEDPQCMNIEPLTCLSSDMCMLWPQGERNARCVQNRHMTVVMDRTNESSTPRNARSSA